MPSKTRSKASKNRGVIRSVVNAVRGCVGRLCKTRKSQPAYYNPMGAPNYPPLTKKQAEEQRKIMYNINGYQPNFGGGARSKSRTRRHRRYR